MRRHPLFLLLVPLAACVEYDINKVTEDEDTGGPAPEPPFFVEECIELKWSGEVNNPGLGWTDS